MGSVEARRSQPNNAKGSQLVKVMRMSRPELLCGIPVHSFRLHLLVSLNSLHGICFARRSQPIAALLRQSAVNDVQLYSCTCNLVENSTIGKGKHATLARPFLHLEPARSVRGHAAKRCAATVSPHSHSTAQVTGGWVLGRVTREDEEVPPCALCPCALSCDRPGMGLSAPTIPALSP
jgi:hypothetical protein